MIGSGELASSLRASAGIADAGLPMSVRRMNSGPADEAIRRPVGEKPDFNSDVTVDKLANGESL